MIVINCKVIKKNLEYLIIRTKTTSFSLFMVYLRIQIRIKFFYILNLFSFLSFVPKIKLREKNCKCLEFKQL